MPHITLPARTPTTLRAFWLVASTGVGLTVGLAASLGRRDARLLALAIPAATAVAVPGLRRPYSIGRAYGAWDRLGPVAAEIASHWISRVAFEVMRAGASGSVHHGIPTRPTQGGSGWLVRSSQPSRSYPYQDAKVVRADDRENAFTRYIRTPGNGWARPLKPLVALLATMELDDEIDEQPPSDIYTLY